MSTTGITATLPASDGPLGRVEESDLVAAQAVEIATMRRVAVDICSERDRAKAIVEKLEHELASTVLAKQELEGLLREISGAYHDNRAGGRPGAADRLEDAICRIDTALANR